jgi:PAS domain-containing protein
MFIAWGADRVWLYNDAFVPILGHKHPEALGLRAIEEVWREARSVLEPLFDRVFAGEAVHMEDFEVVLDRNGQLGEARFAFSYTPVRDDTGGRRWFVRGVYRDHPASSGRSPPAGGSEAATPAL